MGFYDETYKDFKDTLLNYFKVKKFIYLNFYSKVNCCSIKEAKRKKKMLANILPSSTSLLIESSSPSPSPSSSSTIFIQNPSSTSASSPSSTSASISPSSPSQISPHFYNLPKEVWKTHICTFLTKKELGHLRQTCKWFRNDIIGIDNLWLQWIPFQKHSEYVKKYKKLGWGEAPIYGIYFTYVDYYTFSQTSFQFMKPCMLQEIDLSACEQITDPDLNFLPENLYRLILPWRNQLSIVKIECLLGEKVRLRFRNAEGNVAGVLYWACMNESFQLAAFCLLEQNREFIDINFADRFGMTPLFIASRKRYLPIAELLLENGTDINRPTHKGETPLMIASAWNHGEIVELLIKYGANLDLKDNKGRTALDIARKKGNKEIVKMLEEYKEQSN